MTNPHIAFILILCAGISDFLDGFLARYFKITSNLGRILDPTADKFFILLSFLGLYLSKIISVWIFLLFIIRELLIILGLYVLSDEVQMSIQPSRAGKMSAALQYCYLATATITSHYAEYMLYPTLVLSYYSMYLYANIAIQEYIKPYKTDHLIQKQQKMCLIISASENDSTSTQIAINTFPHAYVLELNNYNIDIYTKNKTIPDDFQLCLQKLLEYDLLIFVTPVYWYSTTAKLKIFLDRLADLLYISEYSQYKLQFAQKSCAAIVQYSRDPGYTVQILEKTCKYFKANFVAHWSVYKKNISILQKKNFQRKCFNAIKY